MLRANKLQCLLIIVWLDTSSWEYKAKHQWSKELRPTQDISLLIEILLVLLICFIWNTQVSIFQPSPFPFLSNTLSLTLLICCSLSLYLHLLPTLFSPVAISYEYSDNFVYGIIEWTLCFTYSLLTIIAPYPLKGCCYLA